jgi:glycopeptide antibiotics resistance protein
MTDAPMPSNMLRTRSGWSNRVLILVTAGILFITLYPFRFDFGRHFARALFPFSLNGWGTKAGSRDAGLNILLFVPYGFALAAKLQERGKSRLATLGLTFAAGALLSYMVEFLQIWIPPRDSGWEDVCTNSFGAAGGAVLCNLCGEAVFRLLSRAGRNLGAWLIWQKAVLALLLYLGLWCVIAVPLEKQSRLSGWNSDALLIIGNAASNPLSVAWKGQVFAVEMWDHAVSPKLARRLSSQTRPDAADPDSIVAYLFSGSIPVPDERRFLPDLSWMPKTPTSEGPDGAFLDGKSWLMTEGAVPALVSDLTRTGQFSLRVLCEPAEIDQVDAQIVSVSSRSGSANMELRQEDAKLVFWFRAPLSLQRSRMSWTVPDAFVANEEANILLSYDGARLNLYINGKEQAGGYELGAGAALARFVRRIKADELAGYQYLFCALVFFPVGCLVGFVWRSARKHWIGLFRLVSGLVLPAVLLEMVLVHVSGRPVSFENIWLSILLAVGGAVWINADRSCWQVHGEPGEVRSTR